MMLRAGRGLHDLTRVADRGAGADAHESCATAVTRAGRMRALCALRRDAGERDRADRGPARGSISRQDLQDALPRVRRATPSIARCGTGGESAPGAGGSWRAAAPGPVITAFTLSLDTPEKMRAAAARHAHRPLLKIKLGTPDDMPRLEAVRAGAPEARSSSMPTRAGRPRSMPILRRISCGWAWQMVEQPLPAGEDDMLAEIARPLPVCADESCHDRAAAGARASTTWSTSSSTRPAG
jgi:hypothetical protein